MPDPEQVTILNEYRYPTYPTPGNPVIKVSVTYQKGMGVPRTVYLDEKDFNDAALRKAIAADIAGAADKAPRTLTL